MKFRFIRLTKFLLVVLIIFSFVFSSYASLSANDGSAFVSRPEFENALADFSSRFKTFEEGVNSKIDSQVTSYLDRNGIWNGEQQQLNPDELDLKSENFPAPTVDANTSGQKILIDKKIYIPKITKTGMLVGSWYWKATGGNDNNTRWGYNGNVGNKNIVRSSSGFNLVLKFEEYDKNGVYLDLPYSAIVLQAQGDVNGNAENTEYNACASISTEKLVTPYKFFVNKDSCIKWSLVMHYRFFDVSSVSPRIETNSKISIFLEKAQVY